MNEEVYRELMFQLILHLIFEMMRKQIESLELNQSDLELKNNRMKSSLGILELQRMGKRFRGS